MSKPKGERQRRARKTTSQTQKLAQKKKYPKGIKKSKKKLADGLTGGHN
jgi:hypothetical protein